MDRYCFTSFVFLQVIGLAVQSAAGAPPSSAAVEEEQAIRAAAKQYQAAIERGDSKQLSQLWTADGDYVDEAGQAHPASELIAQGASAEKPARKTEIKLSNNAIRLLTPDVAIEDGIAEVASAGRSPLRGRFTAVWVKQGGKWKLASLRESRFPESDGSEQLEQLEWMIGQWSGQNGTAVIDVSTQWNPTHTFLVREVQVLPKGQPVFNATQRIGWDPLTRTIRSWMFDSRGGYGDGTWTRQGESWVVQAKGVLPNGKQTSTLNIYTTDGKDAFTWKSTGARTDGEPSPDLEYKLIRKRS